MGQSLFVTYLFARNRHWIIQFAVGHRRFYDLLTWPVSIALDQLHRQDIAIC